MTCALCEKRKFLSLAEVAAVCGDAQNGEPLANAGVAV